MKENSHLKNSNTTTEWCGLLITNKHEYEYSVHKVHEIKLSKTSNATVLTNNCNQGTATTATATRTNATKEISSCDKGNTNI